MRYKTRRLFLNNEELYSEQFENRDVQQIKHYGTPKMNHVTSNQMKNLDTIRHVWKAGDKFYKLAARYYNDPKLWWVIAWFNKTPTESHSNVGDLIFIPMPLEEILKIYGVYY